MAQAVREKAEQDAKYEPRHRFMIAEGNGSGVTARSQSAGEIDAGYFTLWALHNIFLLLVSEVSRAKVIKKFIMEMSVRSVNI